MSNNMNNDTHPELEQLAAFSEAPAATEHSELRRHLADCTDCRQQLDQLDIMSRSLQMSPPVSEAANLSNELLQAIDSAQLNANQQRALHNDPVALKAALHYAVHAPAMQKHLDQPIRKTIPANTTSQTPGLLQTLLEWRPPAWGAIPVSAAAALALALVVLPQNMPPESSQLIVASYADRPILELQGPAADLPGMGFFHGADAREIPFDGLQLSFSRTDGLSANWSPVENAKNYHLRLTQITADSQLLVAEVDVDRPQANFSQLQPAPGRYHWLLTGQAADGTRFRASGGFVVNGRR